MAKWTKDQQKAIEEYGYNIIDSAGAGSGKTAVLSERVKYFVVEKGYSISEFLIVTFTKLAAGEMKHRIREKLEKANSTEANFVDTADITTFDAFANSIVKKYHYLLNVSPNVGIVDSNVINVMKTKIVDDMFEEMYLQNNELFEKMVSSFCFKDDNDIRDLVIKLQAQADLALNKENFFDTYVSKFYCEEFLDKVLKETTDLMSSKKALFLENIAYLPDVRTKKGGPFFVDEVNRIFKNFFNATTYNEMISSFLSCETYPRRPSGVDDSDKQFFEMTKDAYDDLSKFIKELPKNEDDLKQSIISRKEYAQFLIDLARELDRKQYEYKVSKQVFEFQDIAKMALELVQSNKEVREEIKSKYKMIMIDEYQDTSALQEAFISLISKDNVFMVGDIKQSIYAFRNARSDIFADKYSLYKNHKGGEVIDMNKNFRSREEVLQDINHIFSRIMTLNLGGADYKKDHIIEYGLLDYKGPGDNPSQNNHATFIMYDKEDEEACDKKEQEARIIAEDIIKKINSNYTVFERDDNKHKDGIFKRKCEFKDFCIIMDRGTSFELYKEVFTEYNIPLYVEQDEDIKDNIIVQLLSNLVRLIKGIKESNYDSDFALAYLSIARSFIYETKDEELYFTCKNKSFLDTKVCKDIIEVMNANEGLSNYELLIEIIFKMEIYSKLVLIGDVNRNALYLDTFISYFKQMSDLDYSLDDFITYLKDINDYNLKINLPATGSNLNSVKIINIHKSKGLEFPIVYFSGLDVKFNRQESKSKFASSTDYGLIMPSDGEEKYIIKTLANIKANRDDLSEKIRLLYVALTRTREKMIFVLPSENKVVPIENAISFDNLLRPLANEFEVVNYSYGEETPYLEKNNDVMAEAELILKKISFDIKEKEVSQVSKHLKLNTNKELLEYGTYLHEVMEIIDFNNPDYSIIKDEKAKNMVKRFLSNDLLKDVSNAIAYKEYEFISDDHQGIIDLFLLYEDHITLIDYKTKNIDDEKYDDQINVYKEYLKNLFNLPVEGYLYSLIDGTLRHIK